jgi:hypothetical protein
MYISSVNLARLMTSWLTLWSGEVINTIVMRATMMEKILYGAWQYVLSTLTNDSLLPPIWFWKRGTRQTIGFRVLLAPLNFYKRVVTDDVVPKQQKLCPYICSDQWPTSIQTPISTDVPRKSFNRHSRCMDTLVGYIGIRPSKQWSTIQVQVQDL